MTGPPPEPVLAARPVGRTMAMCISALLCCVREAPVAAELVVSCRPDGCRPGVYHRDVRVDGVYL